MSGTIIANGHVYRQYAENIPCPMPGNENLAIMDKFEGQPAIWFDRIIYILIKYAKPTSYPDARVVS